MGKDLFLRYLFHRLNACVFSTHFFGFDISAWILAYTLIKCLDNDATGPSS